MPTQFSPAADPTKQMVTGFQQNNENNCRPARAPNARQDCDLASSSLIEL